MTFRERFTPTEADSTETGRLRSALDNSGPEPATTRPSGGSLRVRGKGVIRHVAELDALVIADTLAGIIGASREVIDTRLALARTEVELNVWRSTAH